MTLYNKMHIFVIKSPIMRNWLNGLWRLRSPEIFSQQAGDSGQLMCSV